MINEENKPRAQATLFGPICSVCMSSCMDQKKTTTRPDCNQMQPNHWLWLHAFQNQKLPKTKCNQTSCNWLQLVLGTS